MTPAPDRADIERLATRAARAAAAKKASDPVVLDVGPVLGVCDFFLIVSGANERQVRAIAEEIEARLKDDGGPVPLRVEGRGEGRWLLLDYGDLVVHVFHDEARAFYDLERLWRDVERIDWVPADEADGVEIEAEQAL